MTLYDQIIDDVKTLIRKNGYDEVVKYFRELDPHIKIERELVADVIQAIAEYKMPKQHKQQIEYIHHRRERSEDEKDREFAEYGYRNPI